MIKNLISYRFPKFGDLTKALCFIGCSSGTTGLPKGVCISHAMAITGLSLKSYVAL